MTDAPRNSDPVPAQAGEASFASARAAMLPASRAPAGTAAERAGCVQPPYVPPPGISLLFCSRAEILAAPEVEREAYYRLVEGILADPGACGFRHETWQDLAADDAVDRGLAGLNNDWTAP
jgi:hypothetical protein